MENKKYTTEETQEEARRDYAGADVDAALDNTVDSAEVKADVKDLNNNPY